jgi:hypothetical protein
MSCSFNSIQSFPVGLTFPITTDIYTSVLQPLTFDFQWGTRTTNPQFVSAQNGLIDETDTSTLRYNGLSYKLESVQFTIPTHKTWIIPQNSQIDNYEDIILTFSDSNTAQYIVIIVPIIRVAQTLDAPYLNAIGTANSAQQISIGSVIPSGISTTFAIYSTCVNRTELGTPSQSVLNIIAVDGLKVTDLTMARIKTAYIAQTQQTQLSNYIGYTPPLSIKYSNELKSFQSDGQFRLNVITTRNILVPPTSGVGPIKTPVEETVDAYKCVPFDPDKQMVNGKITVDPRTGTPLTVVESKRSELKTNMESTFKVPPEIYSKYVSSALAFFFTGIIIVVVIYFLIGAAIGPSVIGHGGGFFSRLFKNLTNVPAYSIIGILCGFIGFMIGMVVKYRQ